MSHQVTITRTTTTTTTSAILVNTGYLTSIPGILKILQTILGAVCVGIMGYYANNYYLYYNTYPSNLFFFLMVTTFLIATFCLLLASALSLSSGTIIGKTLYELIYHSFGFILLLAASINLLVDLDKYRKRQYGYEAFMAAAVIGLINSGLYLLSTFFAFRTYRLP